MAFEMAVWMVVNLVYEWGAWMVVYLVYGLAVMWDTGLVALLVAG